MSATTSRAALYFKLRAARTHYALLGVHAGTESDALRTAHRTLAAMLHPDRHPADAAAAELMARVNVAYSCLRDPAAAARYAAELRALKGAAKCPVCKGVGYKKASVGFKGGAVLRGCVACAGSGVNLPAKPDS